MKPPPPVPPQEYQCGCIEGFHTCYIHLKGWAWVRSRAPIWGIFVLVGALAATLAALGV